MDPTITIVVQGLAFFAVAWIVMKFGWPNIIAAIEDRQKKIAEGLAAAERGEKSLAEAKNSAADIIKEAHARAAKIIESFFSFSFSSAWDTQTTLRDSLLCRRLASRCSRPDGASCSTGGWWEKGLQCSLWGSRRFSTSRSDRRIFR